MIDLRLGDCLELMKTIPDGSIDLTVTSPPYDNLRTYNGNNALWGEHVWKEVIKQLHRVTKIGGVVVWVVGDSTKNGSESGTSFKQALWAMECWFNLHDTMIYRKKNYLPLTHNRYEQEWEYMFVFSRGKPKTFNPIMIDCKYAGTKVSATVYKDNSGKLTKLNGITIKDKKIAGNIFEYLVGSAVTGKVKHPAMFPEKLACDQILSWSEEGDTVFDPFTGSGTTGKVCMELKRKFIGFELDEVYFDIAKNRILNSQSSLM